MDAAHDLEVLAKRVEAAAGPDRELFREAWLLSWPRSTFSSGRESDFAREGFMHLCDAGAWLDAATLLVPEGWFWDVGGYRDGSGNATVQAPDYDEDTFNGISVWIEAKTPSLALAAASLRALSQGVNDG